MKSEAMLLMACVLACTYHCAFYLTTTYTESVVIDVQYHLLYSEVNYNGQ